MRSRASQRATSTRDAHPIDDDLRARVAAGSRHGEPQGQEAGAQREERPHQAHRAPRARSAARQWPLPLPHPHPDHEDTDREDDRGVTTSGVKGVERLY